MSFKRATLVVVFLVVAVSLFSACKERHKPDGWKPTVFFPEDLSPKVVWRGLVTDRQFVSVKDFLYDYKPIENGSVGIDLRGNAVYVGGSDGKLFKFDRLTGKRLAMKNIKDEIFSQPVVKGNMLYLGASSGYILALDKDTLDEIWKYNAKSEIVATPVVDGDKIYFLSQNETITALNAKTGTFIWEHRELYTGNLSIRMRPNPVIVNGKLYQGFAGGTLCAFNSATGELLWRKNLGKGSRFDDIAATPVVVDGFLYTASFDNGVYCLNADSGVVLWYTKLKSAGSPTIIEDTIYVTASEYGFYALDKQTGKIEWYMDIQELYMEKKEGAISKPYLYKDRFLVFTTSNAGLYFLDFMTRKLVTRFTPGNGIAAAPTPSGEFVFVMSNGGYVYSVALAPKGSPYAPNRR